MKRLTVTTTKILGVGAFVLAGAFGTGSSARAQSYGAPLSVLLDGHLLRFDVPPSQVNGRILVPLRGVFESLGANVDFDAATNNIFAVRGATQIQLRLGSNQADVNGNQTALDVPAQSRNGRTLVPLRFVSEALGASVNWNAAQQTVFITSPAASQPQPQSQPQPPVETLPPPVAPVSTPPDNRTNATVLHANLVQIRQLISQYRDDHNGRAPASLSELKRYSQGYPDQLWVNPFDDTPLVYDPANGSVYAAGQEAPAPVPQPLPPTPSVEGTIQTMEGTIFNVRSQARGFDIRTHDGTEQTIELTSALPAQVNDGDIVQVTGRVRGGVLRVDVDQLIFLKVISRLQFDGTVESILDNNRLVVQNARGDRFTVHTRDIIPADVNVGDTVHADGQWDGTTLEGGRVALVHSGTVAASQPVDFNGTVDSVNDGARTLVIRGDNQTLYSVYFPAAGDFQQGDTVHVVGKYVDGVTTATTITRR